MSADEKSIAISYWGGDCDDHAAAAVDETSEQVAITILVSGGDRKYCNTMAYARTIAVHLDEPLGNRELVDGGDGQGH